MLNRSVLCRYAAALAIGLIPGPGVAQPARDYKPVTDERLRNPEPENWLMTRGNYHGWSYSALNQITTGNVKKLVPVWTFSTGVLSGHEAPAIVNSGVMFVSTPYNQVFALDAKTGDLLWKYKRDLPEDFSALHYTNRGVALYGDKVYIANLDATISALDARTGKVVWDTPVIDWRIGSYITSAPLAVKGKVMIGPSGGEFGVRGFVAGFDTETGKLAWQRYFVPAPGEPGSETWPKDGDQWKRGGATAWMPGNYDPETDILYWGAGNGSPWFGDMRPGDNLYVSSTMALDPQTGAVKGHYQYHWNDSWDWAAMNAPTLIDFRRDGRSVKGLISPQRNGYLYWLERHKDGRISYVNAVPYVKQNVFKSLDPKTGRPTYHEDRKPGLGKKATYCPSLWGGKDWTFEAYNPQTGMIYIPANDNHCTTMEGKVQEYVPGKWYAGVDIPDIGFEVDKDAKSYGQIQAWDVNSGKQAWTHHFPKSMNWGPVLTTAGGLVFVGGTNDRKFRAFDAKTGTLLWEFTTNSGIISPPSSFAVGGKQYIAVVSGWGVDAAFQQGLLSERLGWQKEVPQGGVIWVFALGD